MTRLRPGHRYGQRLESLSRLMILALLVTLPFGLPGQARGQTDDPPAETTPDNAAAMRWWDALNPEQRLAALHGDDEPTPEQTAAAENPYADLEMATKVLVNDTADAINGNVEFASVGAWWQSLLDCRLKRIAVGDGNTEDTDEPLLRPLSGLRQDAAARHRRNGPCGHGRTGLARTHGSRRLSPGYCRGHALVERPRRGSKGCRVARRRRNTRTRAKGRRRAYVRGPGPGDQNAGSQNHRGNRPHHSLEQRRRLVGVPQLPPEARRHGRRQHRRTEQAATVHTIRAPA